MMNDFDAAENDEDDDFEEQATNVSTAKER